ncbi:hypothetical protein INT48_004587 [Thamnidium elegans]|uniref:Sodium/calcium exchanger membrane region domain-containing protein n=1 Tax=Thamnidium elegans TaxID=101142 RepID=A0A8H7SXY7_9FUNG|nr:hypothetical protein INT48_004587 [Thamnidium elegans]
MAGVTVLALGNGSPDLFSTFSAMDTGAGSLAIGELIGAGFFIVAIVSGCMGIIKPFQSQKITFMRDASFLTGAIMIITWIVYHQHINWYHSIILIGYYLCYVSVVVFGAYSNSQDNVTIDCKCKSEQASSKTGGVDETTHLLGGHIIRPISPNSSRPSLHFDAISRSTSVNGSIYSRTYRRPMTPRIGIRTSVFGAIEFQEQVNNIRRANSSLSILPNHYRNRQNSMPPPMWQNSQGHQHPQHTQPNEIFSTAGNGRQRASTMTDKLLTLSAPSASAQETQDYFTYLSAHNQHQFINIQSSSPPPPPQLSVQTPEMSIPEIRLAPPNNNNENRIPSPEYIDIRNNQFWSTSPVVGRSRGQSTHSLAPPSILSDVDDSTFYSCRQSFEISPSDSFDHQNQLLSAIMNIPRHHQEENEDHTHSSVFQGVLQLNIPNNEGGVSSLLNPTNNPSLYHYRENSDYSFHSKCCHHGPPTPYSKWYLVLEELVQIMLPTLQGWKEKSFFSKLSSLAAAPLVLVFTVTLPVAEIEQVKVDDIEVIETLVNEGISTKKSKDAKNYLSVPVAENDVLTETKVIIDDVDTRQGWNKYLMVLQSVISTTFLFGVFAVNGVIPGAMVIVGVGIGLLLAVFVIKTTKVDEPPSWFWLLSFLGFFVALNWIFLLANEVVGLLQAIGEIFAVSDAIMGLTVFALGNSVGDFVANTAIAKMGFPTMAISACYAGPLLNMVLGVGVSSLYQFWKTGQAYQLDIAPTIIVSSIGLNLK